MRPSFRSEPGLHPPGACVNLAAHGTAPGDLFVTPLGTGNRGNGAAIFDNRDHLIWYDPLNAMEAHNLQRVTYRGQHMLAFYQGEGQVAHGLGEDVLMNNHYQVVAYIRAGNGDEADAHEFTMTPQNTALIGCYVAVTMNLTAYGGAASQVVWDYVVQEIDVATGNVLFSWDSLDHVPVSDSYYSAPANGRAFDYFHGNSIALSPDGNLLISGRRVSAVYEVNRATGKVIWELGGKHSSFTLAPGQQWFCYQHHARQPKPNVITLFDDGGAGPSACPNHASRGLTLKLDPATHKVTITRDLSHNPPLHAGIWGSDQTLPHGDDLVSWGDRPEITEFNPADKPDFDMSFSGPTYRAFRAPWTGIPYYPPAVASRKGPGDAVTVYASWNGDTQVKSWQLLAGSSASSLRPAGRPVAKTGFQAKITVHTAAPLVAAQARDGSGKVLARSPTVPTSYTPPGRGYYVGTRAGNVYNFDAPFDGSLASSHRKPAAPLVGTVVPPTRSGYYLPSSAGHVYNFGAPSYGSLAPRPQASLSGGRPGGLRGHRLLPGHLGGQRLQLREGPVRRLTP